MDEAILDKGLEPETTLHVDFASARDMTDQASCDGLLRIDGDPDNIAAVAQVHRLLISNSRYLDMRCTGSGILPHPNRE